MSSSSSSFLFGVLCLSSLLLVCGQEPVARPGLCLSTSSNTAPPLNCDVAVDGILQPNWQTAVQKYVYADQPKIYAMIDPTAPGVGPAGLTQPIEVEYAYEDTGSANAFWSNHNETSIIGPAGAGTTAKSFNSTLVCQTTGWSNYTIAVIPVSAGTPYFPLVLHFQKQCVLPVMEVGTFIQDSNVIHQNKEVSTFSSYIYTSDITQINFLVFLNAVQNDPGMVQQPFTLTVSTSQTQALTITPLSVQGWSGTALPAKDLEASVPVGFQCTGHQIGALDIPVYGVLNFGWNDLVVFNFVYRCGVGEPVKGLNIGTSSAVDDIAVNGRLVYPWNETFVYSPDQTYDFTLAIDSTEVDQLVYNITIIPEHSEIFRIEAGSPVNGVLGVNMPVIFLSSILCQSQDTARALIQLEFQNYDPIQIQIRYTCALPLFNIGDEPLSNNIIAASVDQGWVGHANGDKYTAEFFIMLDSTSPVSSNRYLITPAQWNDEIMHVELNDPNGGNATTDPESDKNPVTLTFNCIPCVEAYGNDVVISIFYGWSVPFTIHLTKDCTITQEEEAFCNKGGGGGWSPAGIAVFVIFLLIFGFCVSGCLYNRFKENKSGWSTIPGGETFMTFIDNCRTGGRNQRWSPQEDTETGGASSGASYQSAFASGHANYSTNSEL